MGKGWKQGQAKYFEPRMERRRAEQKGETLFSQLAFERGLKVSAKLCAQDTAVSQGDLLWADRSEQGFIQLINGNVPVAFLEGMAADQISKIINEHGACVAHVSEVILGKVIVVNVSSYLELNAAE